MELSRVSSIVADYKAESFWTMKIAILIFLHVNTLKIGLKREEKCLDDEQYFCNGEKCGRWNCSESKARVKKFLPTTVGPLYFIRAP